MANLETYYQPATTTKSLTSCSTPPVVPDGVLRANALMDTETGSARGDPRSRRSNTDPRASRLYGQMDWRTSSDLLGDREWNREKPASEPSPLPGKRLLPSLLLLVRNCNISDRILLVYGQCNY